MNIYAALKKDHQSIETLLNQLVASSETDNNQWHGLVDRIREELIPHSRAEEAVLYNALRDEGEAGSLVAHSFAEHAMAETDLLALQAMKAIDVNWTTLAKKLRTDLLHHVEEEEGKVFPAARKCFNDEEARMMGGAFERMKPSIREKSFAGTTIDLIANLMPPRLMERFRNRLAGSDGGKKVA